VTDYTLVLNAGSSSLKFCVYQRTAGSAWRLESRGQVEGIGTNPKFSAKDEQGTSIASDALGEKVSDARSALNALATWLRGRYSGSKVLGVGHRVVHGGARFTTSTVVNSDVIEQLRQLVPLAPLHQPHNVAAIEAVAEQLPGVSQVACFDTSFHRGQPAVAELVPFPVEIRRAGVQRYGFHGLSYEYIASQLPKVAPAIANGRVVVAHLGSGASLCALKDLKSVDTTMGFTALDGLCMGTRPGSVDPGAILYLFQNLGLSAKEVETMLYKQCGLLGVSGISNDMRDLIDSKEAEAKLAVDYFVYRASKEIGALSAAMGGIDALVFTAGIGEKSAEIRRRICESSSWLGIALNQEANERHESCITHPKAAVSAWVIPTNEELMIARHTWDLLGLA